MILYSEETYGDNNSAYNDSSNLVAQTTGITKMKHQSTHDTGRGINIFSENKRCLIDKDVSQYTTCSAGDCTHDNGNPKRKTFREFTAKKNLENLTW